MNYRSFIATLAGVTVLPLVAVQRGPDGPFAFVVRADSTGEGQDDHQHKQKAAHGRQPAQGSLPRHPGERHGDEGERCGHRRPEQRVEGGDQKTA